eukprot:scaffold20984_cov139-Skeletonema_marinoi.AAC.1
MSGVEETDDIMMMCCASCGIAGVDDVKLKKCTACYLVRYCSVECQKEHRPQHKRACKKRAAELRDEILFKQPESTHRESDEDADKNLIKRIEANDSVALCHMGVRCNIEGDHRNAFEYFTKAAALGDALAHYKLWILYSEGRGVVQKDKKKE